MNTIVLPITRWRWWASTRHIAYHHRDTHKLKCIFLWTNWSQ
jgi:hypothetical protein